MDKFWRTMWLTSIGCWLGMAVGMFFGSLGTGLPGGAVLFMHLLMLFFSICLGLMFNVAQEHFNQK